MITAIVLAAVAVVSLLVVDMFNILIDKIKYLWNVEQHDEEEK